MFAWNRSLQDLTIYTFAWFKSSWKVSGIYLIRILVHCSRFLLDWVCLIESLWCCHDVCLHLIILWFRASCELPHVTLNILNLNTLSDAISESRMTWTWTWKGYEMLHLTCVNLNMSKFVMRFLTCDSYSTELEHIVTCIFWSWTLVSMTVDQLWDAISYSGAFAVSWRWMRSGSRTTIFDLILSGKM